MRILICSDGTDPADNPTRLGGLIAGPCHSPTTLLGIVEDSVDKDALQKALDNEAKMLRERKVSAEIVIRSGEPIRQILAEVTSNRIRSRDHRSAAQRRRRSLLAAGKNLRGHQSGSTTGLVAIGTCDRLKKILVCTGGKKYIDDAVQVAGEIAEVREWHGYPLARHGGASRDLRRPR